MGVLAKREIYIRFLGLLLFFLGLIFSVVSDFFLFQDKLIFNFLLIINLVILSFILCLKLELNLIRENFLASFILICLIVITLFIVSFDYVIRKIFYVEYIFILCSNILIIVSWHYSISYYKKKKLIFLFGFIIYVLVTFFLRLGKLIYQIGLIIGLLPLILIISGVTVILVIEIRMMRRGLLKFV